MRAEPQLPGKAVLERPDGDSESEPPPSSRKHMVRVAALLGWGLVMGVVFATAVHAPSATNIIMAGAFCVLFVLVNLQLLLMRWMSHRRWRRVTGRLMGSAYLSDFQGLPNRNYVLAELRREMPRARSLRAPFVLVQLSLDDIAGVRERRGKDFGDRAVNALAEVLKRLTRSSDFLAHLGEARFCVMLVECTSEQSWTYLRRVPGSIAVSDGHHMFDVPVTARIYQYDLESLYATDVLQEVEDMRPLRRREEPRAGSIAA